MAPLGATPFEYATSAGRRHPGEEPVGPLSPPIAGLIGTFHLYLSSCYGGLRRQFHSSEVGFRIQAAHGANRYLPASNHGICTWTAQGSATPRTCSMQPHHGVPSKAHIHCARASGAANGRLQADFRLKSSEITPRDAAISVRAPPPASPPLDGHARTRAAQTARKPGPRLTRAADQTQLRVAPHLTSPQSR